jgi:outer membrane receptor protein involved in Fe transport
LFQQDANDSRRNFKGENFMKLCSSFTRPFAFLLGLLLVLAGNAFAQSSNGSIVGTITDKTGGAVANASVKIVSIDRGGDARSTTTDSVGTYRVSSLLPGKYKVSIEANGFAPTVVNDIDVRASLEVNASAVLEITSASSTVTVEGNVGQELETQSGVISGNISTAEVVNLPYFTGNPLELLLTEPGVQASSGRDAFTSNGQGFSSNGARPRGNNFLLDGQDNNDAQITGQAVQTINHEAIGEVTVILNSSSAEFGRGGGAIANEVYKGGTNNWHGSGWDIIQPSALSAIDANLAFFGTTRQPVQITNTFGFSLGGPIKKNKLFFFATPQWGRFRANAGALTSPILIPTANGVAALQQIEANEGPNANIDYLIASLGTLRGTSNGATMVSAGFDGQDTPQARPAVEFGTLSRGDGSILSNNVQWSTRLDYVASDHDQLTLRVLRGSSNLTPDFFNNPQELPAFETEQRGPFSNYHASWVHTISSKMVNELRFSYGNIQFEFTPAAATLASPIGTHFTVILNDLPNPNGTAMSYGLPGNEPASRNHQTYQFQDAFSWSFGKHTLKFGGDMALVFVKDGIPVDPRGTITFFPTKNNSCRNLTATGPTVDCNSLTNYIDNFTGPSGAITKFFGNNQIHPFLPNYAPYVQDTWRIKQNLTLDLGLRYEYWGTPGNDLQFPSLDSRFGQGLVGATFPSVFAAQQQGDKNNFAPRVGIAYTPHFWPRIFGGDKTVIRAGYGIFYDGLFSNILDNTAAGSPNGIAQSIIGPATPKDELGRGTANASGTLAALQPVLSSSSFAFTMSSNLLNPITHQWNLNIEHQLPGGFLLTTAYVGTRGEHLFVNSDMNPFLENPNFGNVTARTNGGDSIYHAGELKLERSFSHGLLVRAGYTYSKFIDDMSDVFVTSGSSSYAQDVFNQHGDRGLSSYDHRHKLSLAYLYQLPYVRSRDTLGMAILNAITSGWQTSATITFSTGAPQTFYDGFDNNNDTHGNDRPFLGNAKVPINYSAACLNPAGTCNTGVGFTTDGSTFVDFNSSFGFDPNTGNFTATKNDFKYYVFLGQNGNIGRNTIISPGFQNWNLSVERTVKFKERYAFLIRGELYNAFNHPNLGIPNLALTSQFFDNSAATINGGRIVVLWGKFSF